MKKLRFMAFLLIVMSAGGEVWAQSLSRGPVKPNQKIRKTLRKTPKAIFLIKKAKVDADLGEPVLYPFEMQFQTLYYEVSLRGLTND